MTFEQMEVLYIVKCHMDITTQIINYINIKDMTAKRRFLKNCEDNGNKPSVTNDLDISWSSSSSEEDHVPTKRLKSEHYSESNLKVVNAWIKTGQWRRESSDSTSDNNSLNICSQFTCTTTYLEDVYDKPSISSNHTFEESPIIGSLKLGEVSPVLAFTQNKSMPNLRSSPVIGKQRTSPVIGQRLIKARRIVKDDEAEEPTSKTEPAEGVNESNSLRSQVICNKQVNSKSKRPGNHKHLKHSSKSNTVIESIFSNLSEVSRLNKSPKNIEQLKVKTESCCIYSIIQPGIIIESNSPNSQKTEQSFHNSLNYTIDPFPTQECSEIAPNTQLIETPTSQETLFDADSPQTRSNKSSLDVIINTGSTETSNEIKSITESTETPSSKSSNVEPLYHEVLPKNKKRYKKDGLADQLQKALHKQKTDFAIWRHELYLKKAKGEVRMPTDESLVLMFKINKFWKEFGVTVVECEFIKDQNEEIVNENLERSGIEIENQNLGIMRRLENNDSVISPNINSKTCLVIIGFNVTHSLRIKINAKFKLCMPYKTKIVKYNNELVYCYFNVSKLLSFK